MVYSGCWNGLFTVGGVVLAGLALLMAGRRLFMEHELRGGHDATGNMLAIVGTLYAVLLGLIVVDAMTQFEQTMECVQQESNCLADIFLIAQRLPEPHRSRLRGLCRTYANEVVQLEWPAMEQARMSVQARTTALAIIRSLDDLDPHDEGEKAVYPLLLEQMRELWDHRRERGRAAQYGIPAVEWAVLLIGAAVVLFFLGLFHVEHWHLQAVIATLTSLVIGLNLYLVALFGYPFAGDLTVASRPFELDVAIFEGVYDADPAAIQAGTGPAPAPVSGKP